MMDLLESRGTCYLRQHHSSHVYPSCASNHDPVCEEVQLLVEDNRHAYGSGVSIISVNTDSRTLMITSALGAIKYFFSQYFMAAVILGTFEYAFFILPLIIWNMSKIWSFQRSKVDDEKKAVKWMVPIWFCLSFMFGIFNPWWIPGLYGGQGVPTIPLGILVLLRLVLGGRYIHLSFYAEFFSYYHRRWQIWHGP
jgi:hypothetical protein